MSVIVTKWFTPRPDPVIPYGFTIYCLEPTTLHDICPGYSIPTTETTSPHHRICACTCHEKKTI